MGSRKLPELFQQDSETIRKFTKEAGFELHWLVEKNPQLGRSITRLPPRQREGSSPSMSLVVREKRRENYGRGGMWEARWGKEWRMIPRFPIRVTGRMLGRLTRRLKNRDQGWTGRLWMGDCCQRWVNGMNWGLGAVATPHCSLYVPEFTPNPYNPIKIVHLICSLPLQLQWPCNSLLYRNSGATTKVPKWWKMGLAGLQAVVCRISVISRSVISDITGKLQIWRVFFSRRARC